MAKNQKALIFIAFGALSIVLGTSILCSGGFKSVMIDPLDGPLTVSAGYANSNHYRQLIRQYPELFNCASLNDDVYANANTDNEYTGLVVTDADVRANARAYCRYTDGEQAWTFALYLPIALIVLGVSVAAFVRRSGYTAGLVGVGLSAVMLAFTLLLVVHYQGTSYVPQALTHFTDCDGFTSDTIKIIIGQSAAVGTASDDKPFTPDTAVAGTPFQTAFDNSLQGPIPRRGWLCEGHWDYDSDLKTAANLVYGGAAINFVGFLSLLLAFSYLVQPFVTPVAVFAKAAAGVRGADDVDFESEASYSETEY